MEECNVNELLGKEQYLIETTKSANHEFGYNICEIADKPFMTEEVRNKISNTLKGNTPWNKGIPHSEEAKEKMRQRKLGICGKFHPRHGSHHSEETKEKIRQKQWQKGTLHPMFGKHLSETAKEKIRRSRMGKPLSEVTRQKIRQSNLGKKASAETLENEGQPTM